MKIVDFWLLGLQPPGKTTALQMLDSPAWLFCLFSSPLGVLFGLFLSGSRFQPPAPSEHWYLSVGFVLSWYYPLLRIDPTPA